MKENDNLNRATYSEYFDKYTEETVDYVPENLKQILDYFAERTGVGTALEIGSGPMRDVNYLRSKGVDILPSDFVDGFLNKDDKAIYFDVIKTDISKEKLFDAIIANMVLLHLTVGDFFLALENIYRHLKSDGFIAFSVKLNTKNDEGYRSYVSNHKVEADRHFTDYKLDYLRDLVVKDGLFQVDKIIQPDDRLIVWMFCNKI